MLVYLNIDTEHNSCSLVLLYQCCLLYWQAFFESYHNLCEPSCYKPMLHADHLDELKLFRAKSKSWYGDKDKLSHHTKGILKDPSKTRFGGVRSCRRLPWFCYYPMLLFVSSLFANLLLKLSMLHIL